MYTDMESLMMIASGLTARDRFISVSQLDGGLSLKLVIEI